ncbi:MAG: alpha-amylase family glycosyl hydrolase [Balneolaceae bacterium]
MKTISHSKKEIDFTRYLPGSTVVGNATIFRLFAPDASSVEVIIFDQFEETDGTSFSMMKDEAGIWNQLVNKNLLGKWYAYKLHRSGGNENLSFTVNHPVADPWSKHVTTINHHLQFPKTKIVGDNEFDWEGDDFVSPEDPRDLVIYEAHIKDLVAHSSAKTNVQGVYNDFRMAEVGGLNHLKKMGVNAVEFLPLQKFAYFEPSYYKKTTEGIENRWNPYSINHWGYMTSFFFSPETLYASDASLEPGAAIGKSEKAASELKQVVKNLHKEGISVIMDVVYNHASHYDLNPLKLTARDHYFRLDEKGDYLNDSWTGNDINTSAEWSRKLIVESVKFWMKEFHVDGFRFDLAGMIDWETVDEIKKEAQKINPNVILIAEPWGGEYKPDGFSDHGWASWNDLLRNNFKGYDPLSDKGYIFGYWNHDKTRYDLENLIRGTIREHEKGLFQTSRHAVNYLESHDGYTLGDYIRIASDPGKADQSFQNKAEITALGKAEMKTAKFAALSLFVTQGIIMIHAGQEWARSKVTYDPSGNDPDTGKLDHDSYNKDNETNWLNFNEINLNKELFEYYQGLISLRLIAPALRKAEPDEIQFKVYKDPLHVTFSIDGKSSEDVYDYFVSLNANNDLSHEIKIPEGDWEMVANSEEAGKDTFKSIRGEYNLPPCSGVVLRKLRVNKA